MQLSAPFSNICWHSQGAQLVLCAAGPLDEGLQPLWGASKWHWQLDESCSHCLVHGGRVRAALQPPCLTPLTATHTGMVWWQGCAPPPLLLPQPARPVPVHLQEGGSSAETEEDGSCSLTLRPVPQGSSEVPFWVWIIVAIVGFMLVTCCCLALGMLLYRWAPPGKGCRAI